MKKIYYLGPEGSYSWIVTKQCFSKDNLVPCGTFSEIIDNVISKPESLGVLPIENSITSNIHENIDYMFIHDLKIIGEAYLKINLHLIGIKGAKINNLEQIYSHPKALSQCSHFIEKQKLIAIEANSTAKAKDIIVAEKNIRKACIGSKELAKNKRLEILKENIGNVKNNMTRFIFISSKPIKKLPKLANKITFIFKLKHKPGTLANILTKLAAVKANLTKIESRPIPETNWEYDFWVDIDLSQAKANSEKIIEIITANSLDHKIMGIYQKGAVYES